ncbi:hypothetical protein BaRGS_00019774 [Batillaria attramentaria]|uniref:PX domain-containing protein n=1 Tax=Batillaria attramentaria TaxID=370345 RepID=A0ABD0KP08_9CAEN
MPKATVTVRGLKNKDTGVDLSVTGYNEIPGLVRSTFEYQIVVVSNLSCFKLPSHKESDVVQFTLFRKFNEFEDLRAKLNEEFSGTALPPIVKKSIIVNDAIIRERRNNLDTFLKFLAATPRIVTSSHVLTFLGVDPQKARRFASGEVDESSEQEKGSAEKTGAGGDAVSEDTEAEAGMGSSSLFEEEEEEEEGDDFLTTNAGDDNDADFFETVSAGSSTRMFESQDLKRELTEEDEKDFSFIPDAIVTKREVITVAGQEDNDDLLNVEDDIDFDQFLTMDISGKEEEPQSPNQPQPKPAPRKPDIAQKPSIPTKPKPAPKPTTEKPVLAVKPKPRTLGSENKPPTPERPKPAPRKLKPQTSNENASPQDEGKGTSEKPAAAAKDDGLSTDDIMQYIAANAGDDADVDLFS